MRRLERWLEVCFLRLFINRARIFVPALGDVNDRENGILRISAKKIKKLKKAIDKRKIVCYNTSTLSV